MSGNVIPEKHGKMRVAAKKDERHMNTALGETAQLNTFTKPFISL